MATEPAAVGAQGWPGDRLGLPEHGSGSVAGWGRRIAALVVDWTLSMLSVGAFVGDRIWSGGGAAQWGTLAVFALETWVLTALTGASAGQLLLQVRVVRLAAQPMGLWRPLVRTALVCLVVPAVIYNRDQRGLHDLAVGTITVRL